VESEAIRNLSAVFLQKNGRYKDEIPTEKLYARIGQLTLENDFLKKKSGLVSISEQ
jgi:hypothetical protein